MSQELRLAAREQRREQETLRRKREELSADIRTLAGSPEGRRFFQWILDRGNIFRTDYEPGVRGAYEAGKKAASLELWHILHECLPRSDFLKTALPVRNDTPGTIQKEPLPPIPEPPDEYPL